MNNYEQIKNMTLDKMAEFFAGKIQCRNCFLDFCPDDKDCEEYFKQWLQQESEG